LRSGDFSWEKTIPNCVDACREIISLVVQQLQTFQWDERDLFGVRLALEEALMNAVRHGNRFDASKSIEVVCRISPQVMHIEIADQGPGFHPEEVPDCTDPENLDKPSGRGIMLMRNFMTVVEFNEAGNRVTLEKRRA